MASLAFAAEEGAEAAAALALDASEEEEEAAVGAEGPPVPGAAAADLAEFVWKDTCSSAERKEGCGADEDDGCCCILDDAACDAEAAAAATTLRGHADAAPAVTPSSSSSIVIVGGTSGRTNVPAERRGIAMPSPRKEKPSAEGEKALEADREASLAREVKGSGASGVVAAALDAVVDDEEDEDEDEASAEGAGRRMVAGRTNGMVAVWRRFRRS